VRNYPVVSASDSHYLHTLGSACVEFESEVAGIEGFRQALMDRSTKLIILDDAFRTVPGQPVSAL
jgi:PHP family Zn ribbon phosphoesterase